MRSQRGQTTVEWIGLLLLVGLLLAGILAAGVRVPGTELARAVAERILCAVSMADSCGDEPHLIAAYGTEIGKLVREHMPNIAFEDGSHAVPVDYRRCRSTACGDAPDHGLVHRTDAGLPVAAFVHVVDCRAKALALGESDGIDCSGGRAGHLYIQYWTYYADSATFRGIPVLGDAGYHLDDWEGVQIRIDADGEIDERASSHNGYNYEQGAANWGSDAGIDPLRDLAETVGLRAANGWGRETHWLFVSGGSHAGNADAFSDLSRIAKGSRVHLIPLEPIAAGSPGNSPRFAIAPPWMKRVWRDPEAEGTD